MEDMQVRCDDEIRPDPANFCEYQTAGGVREHPMVSNASPLPSRAHADCIRVRYEVLDVLAVTLDSRH